MTVPGGGLVLPVDKPVGPTSHDVVAAGAPGARHPADRTHRHPGSLRVRVAAPVRGPCDPPRRVPVGAGQDVRGHGPPRRRRPTPTTSRARWWRAMPAGATVSEPDIAEALRGFLGELAQVPPAVLGQEGRGRGACTGAPGAASTSSWSASTVTVHELELLACELPAIRFKLRCSSGTYVRAIARDLGEALGVGAHLTALAADRDRALRRGGRQFRWPRSRTRTKSRASRARPSTRSRTCRGGARMPRPRAASPTGRASAWSGPEVEGPIAVAAEGELLAVGHAVDGLLKPSKVFAMSSARVQWMHPPGIPADRGTVATVGTFDGVHLGHWRVLEEIRERAAASGRRSVLVTFDPHPLRIVRPDDAPPLLTTPVEKKEILAESGLDYAVFVPFTEALSRYEPAPVRGGDPRGPSRRGGVGDRLRPRIRTGSERRRGDDPRASGRELGFAVDVVEPVEAGGGRVSSSRIRKAISDRRLDEARACLGRPYSITRGRRAGRGPGPGTRVSDREPADRRSGQARTTPGRLCGARRPAGRGSPPGRAPPRAAPDVPGFAPDHRAPSHRTSTATSTARRFAWTSCVICERFGPSGASKH